MLVSIILHVLFKLYVKTKRGNYGVERREQALSFYNDEVVCKG